VSEQQPKARDRYAVRPDPLSGTVDELRIRHLFLGGPFSLRRPWAFRHEPSDPQLYLVTQGPVSLRLNDGTARASALRLEPGDIVLLSHGTPHVLADTLETPVQPGAPLDLVDEAGRDTSGYLGMECEFHGTRPHVLVDVLPELIWIKGNSGEPAQAIGSTLLRMAHERGVVGPGHAAVIKRLAEAALIQIVQIWIDQLPTHARGWLSGIKDPLISSALQAMHERPSFRWTVHTLATAARMSRSAFSERFKDIIGETPMAYLVRWRMQLSARMLDAERSPLKAVMRATGYESRATFRRHFKDHFGTLPRDYRSRADRA
jgi:AraC-like DNA-binding protein